jgi:hypothetical protein
MLKDDLAFRTRLVFKNYALMTALNSIPLIFISYEGEIGVKGIQNNTKNSFFLPLIFVLYNWYISRLS